MNNASKDATTVFCPRCETDPGQPCYTDDGSDYAPVHPERVEEFVRLRISAVELYHDWGGDEAA